MRAVRQDRFGGPEVLRVRQVPDPEPLPTEVKVAVRAAGVNPVDLGTREAGGLGVLGDPPFTLGWDVSGVVTEVGMGVTRFAAGDEVYGMPWFPREAGGYAEYVTAPSRHFARKPATLSHVEAAGLPLAGLTAWQALEVAGVAAGQRVLVTAAAGGVGHLAVQIAAARGAYVLGTASAGKHDLLRSLGADEPIDYHAVDVAATVRDVDVVISLTRSEDRPQLLDTLASGGVLVGVTRGIDPAEMSRCDVRLVDFLVEPDGSGLEELTRLVDAGSLRVEVDATYPLEEAAAAHERVATGRAAGKVVLTVSD